MKFLPIKLTFCYAILLVFLTSCGGGSSGGDSGPSPSNPEPPPPVPVPDLQPAEPLVTQDGLVIYGDEDIVSGQSIGFAVVTDSGQDFSSVRWEQTAGPVDLGILASHTQAIGFDVRQAGDYTLNIQATTESSQQLSTSLQFTVSQDSAPLSSVRLDHEATERGRVSLRTVSNNSTPISAIEWTQIAGPEAQDILFSEASASSDEPDNQVLVFNAPAVQSDSAIVFEATTRYTDNTESTDRAIVLVTNDAIVEDGYFASNNLIVTSSMLSLNSLSPYASALESCVYTNSITQTCNFGRLPLIGQLSESPSIQAILDRTLVSHAWMGERFEQYLRTSAAGPDMLLLLRATTAIVISYEVRPSFYWAATGAIYLDARNFWQTPEERDTLNEQRDFRSDFGNDLGFIIPWRYVKDNEYYPSRSYPVPQRLNRTFYDLEASISWLMYHELGHANDFFPPSSWASLSSSNDPLSFFQDNGATSDIVPTAYPLNSDELKALAQVSFSGETASATQRGYLAEDIELFFTGDKSPSYYSYSTTREDFATLFERFMMSYRLNAGADVGILEDPETNTELMVTWGQRHRISEPLIEPRVKFAVENILPNLNVDQIQSTLPAPILMDTSKDWFENIELDGKSESVNANKPKRINRNRPLRSIHPHSHDLVMPIPKNQGQ
jgi:hypothetical protein